MTRKHVMFTLLLAAAFVVQGVTTGYSCDKCPVRCNGDDVKCPYCDEVGGNTCSDVTAKTYNSTSVVRDCQYQENSGLTCVQQDEVICYTTWDCIEGGWVAFKMCSTGSDCSGTTPIPMFCQLCTKTNRTDELVYDWSCE